MKCIKCGSEPRPSDDYIQYGIDPYIDIGGINEHHESKPLPVDDYISGNWREDEKIF